MSAVSGMSGSQLEALLLNMRMKKSELAKRWGVHRTTIQRLCAAEQLPQPYVDAVRFLIVEEHLAGIGFDVDKAIQQRTRRA